MKAVYSVLVAALLTAPAFAGNNFEKVRGISDGSPYTMLTADEGAAGRRGDFNSTQVDAWLEKQFRMTDGSN
ncbi:MAG: hypothetical protein ACREV0_03510 [Burkholderiales bacterium]